MDYAVATGIEKGREEGREEVFSLLRQGYSVDEAERMLAKREAKSMAGGMESR